MLRSTAPRKLHLWRLAAPPPQIILARQFSRRSSLLTTAAAGAGTQNQISVSEAGENKTGHIARAPNEGIFFLDNIFPLKLRWLLRLPYFNVESAIHQAFSRDDGHAASPTNVIERAIPKSLPIKITEIIPRVKEGGSFVKFIHEPGADLFALEKELQRNLKNDPIKPIFNPWRRVRGFLVQGRPWVEDLYRFPSSKVRVEFLPTEVGGIAADFSQEEIYACLRQYGKISDIVSQPADSKVLPKYAFVTFRLTRHAVMAKNCIHGIVLGEKDGGGKAGTLLRLSYQRIVKAHWIRDWLANHPRIVLPILAAIIATITVAIFDPVRTWFIKVHICHAFNLSDNAVVVWLKSQLTRAHDIFSFRPPRSEDQSLRAIWDDRAHDIEQIQAWLMESADNFIVVQGPRGSGKKELVVDEALKGRKHTLVIDCKPIQEARGDSRTINAAAKEVGYRPVFSWMNSISSLIDLAAQGTIGTKTGLSETVDTQLAKIFQNTATALRQIALQDKRSFEKDKDLGDDEFLEAHPELRPVVVVDNFLHKSTEGGIVYDKISEWAASVTGANIAHVIFLTHDVSFSKSLSKALPDRVFRLISLGDCSPEVAKRYVIRHLESAAEEVGTNDEKNFERTGAAPMVSSPAGGTIRPDLTELDGSIEVLGGRLTDLEFLARRIKAGETPKKAVQEIIDQSASEILKMYILDPDRQGSSRGWSPMQAWCVIKSLAASTSDSIKYNAILLSDGFKTGSDSTLQALEQAELISIVSSPTGRPLAIKPGKPVYQAAFRYLTCDKVLSARLDLAVLSELLKSEAGAIEKCESELSLIGGLPKQPAALAERVKYLLTKIQASQQNVIRWEKESDDLKKVLKMDY